MRVMSYNILTGGRDGSSTERLERVLRVVEREQPDFLALQECNLFDAEGNVVFHQFERRLGMRGLLSRADSGFHVALFARDAGFIESSAVTGWCLHAMLKARVQFAGHELELFSVHHNPFSGTARLTESEFIAGVSHPEQLQLVMGDFNANSPADVHRLEPGALPPRYRARQTLRQTTPAELDTRSVAALLEAEFVDTFEASKNEWEPTVPSRLIAESNRFPMRIDFVFASRKLASALRRHRVVVDEHTDAASDHYPVVVDFDLAAL